MQQWRYYEHDWAAWRWVEWRDAQKVTALHERVRMAIGAMLDVCMR
jgi:hypothetical protein